MKANLVDTSNLNTWEELKRFCSVNFNRLSLVLGKGVTFTDNFQGTGEIPLVIGAANQVIGVEHGLSYTPTSYIVTYQNANAVIYVPSNISYPWDNRRAYFMASAAVTARVIIF